MIYIKSKRGDTLASKGTFGRRPQEESPERRSRAKAQKVYICPGITLNQHYESP